MKVHASSDCIGIESQLLDSYADPEIFVRGSPTLIFLVDDDTNISGRSLARQPNAIYGVSL